jgi:general secretion pathway protein D
LFRSESRTKSRTNLMVFLRPIVMRDAEAANRLSMDRYDAIRAREQEAQPQPSTLMPLNDSPLLPSSIAAPTPTTAAPPTPAKP